MKSSFLSSVLVKCLYLYCILFEYLLICISAVLSIQAYSSKCICSLPVLKWIRLKKLSKGLKNIFIPKIYTLCVLNHRRFSTKGLKNFFVPKINTFCVLNHRKCKKLHLLWHVFGCLQHQNTLSYLSLPNVMVNKKCDKLKFV